MTRPGTALLIGVAVALFAFPAFVRAQTPATEDHPAIAPSPPAVEAGVRPALVLPPASPDAPPAQTASPAPTATPAPAEPAKTAEAPMPEPVTLEHPTVVDTARLAGDGQEVKLFGIVGLQGQFTEDLHGAIAGEGDQVTCQAKSATDYTCLLPDGTDVAELALRNGAAQSRDDAPDAYRAMETAARDERRGVWSSLPPPPVQVQHPVVIDTGTLSAGGQTYRLYGVQGLGMPYARDLLGYIEANGDALMCNPQGDGGYYVCLLPDGTDLAKVALVNGAARVAMDAPDSYRIEQGNALTNRRGFWQNASPEVLLAVTSAPPPVVTPYVLVAGDDGADGVSYVGGMPAVAIDGAMVFLAWGGAAGWGYWDGGHHWHGAPGRAAAHMDHYHPGGTGLRGSGAGEHGGGEHGGLHTAAATSSVPAHAQSGNFVHPGATPAAARPTSISPGPAASHPMPNVVHPTPTAARPATPTMHAPTPAAVRAPAPAAVHAPAPAAVHAAAPAPRPAPAPVHAAPARPSCSKPHC